MSAEGTLVAVAELAIGIAGFSGVVVALCGLVTAIALQIWNAVFATQSWPHLVALLWSLFVSMLIFVRVLTVSSRDEPPGA